VEDAEFGNAFGCRLRSNEVQINLSEAVVSTCLGLLQVTDFGIGLLSLNVALFFHAANNLVP
jgi:hypothetical protein